MTFALKSAVNYLLKPLDLAVLNRNMKWERDALLTLYESQANWSKRNRAVECIIFSKDRALQLHALINSYIEKVKPMVPVHVLYDCSTAAHQKAYKQVIDIFKSYQFSFLRQKNSKSFREDIIYLLKSLESERVIFLVDDNLFIEDVDIEDFAKFNTDHFVPTLRMGENLFECFPLQKKQPLPEFSNSDVRDPDKVVWTWEKGIYDWNYPISLDGHLFSTREMMVMTELIPFKAPNSYEGNLQRFNWLFLPRLGVCFRKSKIINIACNKVQTENENICGNVHQDYLLDQWHRGLQMDFRKIYGFVNKSAHQDITFDLIKR